MHGSAEGAETNVNWLSLLPAARLRWQFADRGPVALVGGYVRSANTLTLNWLAYGDPAAPVARVAAAARPGVLVARVGPGTGGNSSFSRIDDDLRRPYTDEFVVGVESGRRESMRFTLTGIARREGNLLAVVNTGVPASGYSTIEIEDEYIVLRNPEDDRTLTVYNRLPSAFGRDTYLLTNPELDAAHSLALKLTAERASERLFILFGATAYLSEGSGGNRGYGPRENDQDMPGELFTNPNAATYSRGRLFTDRGFTIKWTTRYRMPYDITLGAIARYQDGQPFSRLVVVPDLNQGTEAVQAYPNGGTRFTFTGTLDLRLQKGFRVGADANRRAVRRLQPAHPFERGRRVRRHRSGFSHVDGDSAAAQPSSRPAPDLLAVGVAVSLAAIAAVGVLSLGVVPTADGGRRGLRLQVEGPVHGDLRQRTHARSAARGRDRRG